MVVTAEPVSAHEKGLQAEVDSLRRRVRAFRAVVKLVVSFSNLGVSDNLERQRTIAKQVRFEANRSLASRIWSVTTVDPAAA